MDKMTTKQSETAKEWLAKWDNGETVWTIEMGGLGLGYEQAIQVTVAEILRWFIEKNCNASPWKEQKNWEKDCGNLEKAMYKNSVVDNLGLSGAQYGAALSLASTLYKRGTSALDDEEIKDRRIQVSKNFPS